MLLVKEQAEVPRNGDTHSYNTRYRNRVLPVRSSVAVCERSLPERQGLLFFGELPNDISEMVETSKFKGILKSYQLPHWASRPIRPGAVAVVVIVAFAVVVAVTVACK